ncbi:hypothetical protein H9L13_00215 [Sphingomonas lutea]|uniref:ATP-grasp domain-containing protein n=1 Tax=Sphingomonas lutea TaxID=1045317 RepID=A0A7G9SHW6_9SPHN|nr:hypothetical protein [Sphingomonas lutea]QNN67441.1 hypothetical protein H9L13_00215 [Sphingomonas lutea]
MRALILVPPADYAVDWRWAFDPQARALREGGFDVTTAPWNDVGCVAGFDLLLPLVAWGYHQRFGEWLRLLERFERERVPVENAPATLRWNSDKAYLAELSARGVATVPTLTVPSLDDAALEHARTQFGTADLVVKPTVSASAYGTYRLSPGDPVPGLVRGWRMLVQPWLDRITDAGEYSLIFFGERFSHAVSKVPRAGEFRVQPEWGGYIVRCDPPDGALELARAALAAAPVSTTYARVDLVIGNDGGLQVIELELVEPALFLEQAPEAAAPFAAAMRSAVERAREQPLADR